MIQALYLVLAVGLANCQAPTGPPVWPQQFHAVLFQNRSDNLAIVDLWYDWPNGRNLNIIRHQLGKGGTTWDLEWNNKTSVYFDREAKTCKQIAFEVGILPPNWLSGAALLGQQVVDGFITNTWVKADFIRYFEDVDTRRPVKWVFTESGAEFHVMEFTPGKTMDSSLWQAPSYCFTTNSHAISGQQSTHVQNGDVPQTSVMPQRKWLQGTQHAQVERWQQQVAKLQQEAGMATLQRS